MSAKLEAGVEVGSDASPIPGWDGEGIQYIVFIGVYTRVVGFSVKHCIAERKTQWEVGRFV